MTPRVLLDLPEFTTGVDSLRGVRAGDVKISAHPNSQVAGVRGEGGGVCLSGWERVGRQCLQVGTTGGKWACGRLADEGSRVSRSSCLPSAQRLGRGSDWAVAAPRGLASGWGGVSGNGPHPAPPYLAHGSGMVHPGSSCPTCPCLGKGARVLGTSRTEVLGSAQMPVPR